MLLPLIHRIELFGWVYRVTRGTGKAWKGAGVANIARSAVLSRVCAGCKRRGGGKEGELFVNRRRSIPAELHTGSRVS